MDFFGAILSSASLSHFVTFRDAVRPFSSNGEEVQMYSKGKGEGTLSERIGSDADLSDRFPPVP